jgi:hypothetical protein
MPCGYPFHAFRLRQRVLHSFGEGEGLVGQVGGHVVGKFVVLLIAYLRSRRDTPFRISRSVSHLEFVIGHGAPLVFGRPYAMHNGIV